MWKPDGDMARLSRIVVPGVAHHVTQRGNRKQPIFFGDEDRRLYLRLLREGCLRAQVRCLAWCLMDNHVHLILVPDEADGLRAALGEAHRRYTRHVNLREGWRGYLFQGRFASYPMDARTSWRRCAMSSATRLRQGSPRRRKAGAGPARAATSRASGCRMIR
ncbi:transposase [Rhizorhabdus wittichii]|uniref:transposase n=1 Tax=Rhizorhabdus wittichii TaxID=160791 RepID=UPI001ABEEED9